MHQGSLLRIWDKTGSEEVTNFWQCSLSKVWKKSAGPTHLPQIHSETRDLENLHMINQISHVRESYEVVFALFNERYRTANIPSVIG